MTADTYILVDGKPKSVPLLEWARWIHDPDNKRIARDDVGEVYVSTVFLGIDHNYSDEGPPVLFETMVFQNKVESVELVGTKFEYQESLDEYTRRYCTLEEAKSGHRKVVNALSKRLRSVQ